MLTILVTCYVSAGTSAVSFAPRRHSEPRLPVAENPSSARSVKPIEPNIRKARLNLAPLFSHTSKLPLPQALYFEIDTNCRGCVSPRERTITPSPAESVFTKRHNSRPYLGNSVESKLSRSSVERDVIYTVPMSLTSATEITYLKGVGPQRAEVLASRGIHTIGDLLGYLPFRYEDRIRFSTIDEIAPGGTYTIQGEIADCGLARFARGGGAIYHLLVRDATGTLACKFFHGAYLEGRLRKAHRGHGSADIDPRHSGELEMIIRNTNCSTIRN